MEDVFRGVLDSILLAELGLLVALLLAWRLMGSLLESREGTESLQAELQTRAACLNCGWQRQGATAGTRFARSGVAPPPQLCPVCGLAPDESHTLPSLRSGGYPAPRAPR
jgi:hypothetical protein